MTCSALQNYIYSEELNKILGGDQFRFIDSFDVLGRITPCDALKTFELLS